MAILVRNNTTSFVVSKKHQLLFLGNGEVWRTKGFTSLEDESMYGKDKLFDRVNPSGDKFTDAELHEILDVKPECEIVCTTLVNASEYLPEGYDTLVFGKYTWEIADRTVPTKEFTRITRYLNGHEQKNKRRCRIDCNCFVNELTRVFEPNQNSHNFPYLGLADKHPIFLKTEEKNVKNFEHFQLSENVLLCKSSDVECSNIKGSTFEDDFNEFLKKFPHSYIK